MNNNVNLKTVSDDDIAKSIFNHVTMNGLLADSKFLSTKPSYPEITKLKNLLLNGKPGDYFTVEPSEVPYGLARSQERIRKHLRNNIAKDAVVRTKTVNNKLFGVLVKPPVIVDKTIATKIPSASSNVSSSKKCQETIEFEKIISNFEIGKVYELRLVTSNRTLYNLYTSIRMLHHYNKHKYGNAKLHTIVDRDKNCILVSFSESAESTKTSI